MSRAILKGNASGTGTVTLETPNTNTDRTISLPDATGTVMVSGNMPAFSAYQSSGQSISSGTATKVLFQTEDFDTNNNFASSTFTPTVAGYYQFNCAAYAGTTATPTQIYFYKNGAVNKSSGYWTTNGSSLSALIYCNGTTDYVECYIYLATGQNLTATNHNTWFNGSLVRTA